MHLHLSMPSVIPSSEYFQLRVIELSLIKTMVHQYGPSINQQTINVSLSFTFAKNFLISSNAWMLIYDHHLWGVDQMTGH